MAHLTDRQFLVLQTTVALFTEAVRKEEERWGVASAQKVAARGISSSEIKNRIGAQGVQRTLHSLVDLKLLALTGSTDVYSETLRKTSFGKLVGGTRKYRDVEVWYRPTEAGVASAQGKWIRWDSWRVEGWAGSLPEEVRTGRIVRNETPVMIRLSRAEEGSPVWHESVWIGGEVIYQQGLVHHESKIDAKSDLTERAEHLVETRD